MPPRRGCRLAVANEAFFHNAQFVIIRPMPAAFTIGCGKHFDLRTIDKVGHKLGLTIGLSLRSDGHRRRFTQALPYRIFDMDQRVTHAAVTENKRLRAVLAYVKEMQDAAPPKPKVRTNSEKMGYKPNGRRPGRPPGSRAKKKIAQPAQ